MDEFGRFQKDNDKIVINSSLQVPYQKTKTYIYKFITGVKQTDASLTARLHVHRGYAFTKKKRIPEH